jgi:hypothetical protein
LCVALVVGEGDGGELVLSRRSSRCGHRR